MTWYGTVLLVLAALGAVYAFLLWPRCPRRSLGALAGWDYAHRGLWNAQRPENSLPAFAAAVEAGYGIELDVHLTRTTCWWFFMMIRCRACEAFRNEWRT